MIDYITEDRIYALTQMGVSRDAARRLMALSTDDLMAGIAHLEANIATAPTANHADARKAMLAATRRELEIRG